MISSALTLKPMGRRTEAGWTNLEWLLDGYGEDGFVLRHSVREADQHLMGDPERGDHALATVLLWAMRRDLAIRVEGLVSPKLLDGLDVLQSIWERWRPYRYHHVDISVANEAEAGPVSPEHPAIFAFSGGVDGAFSFFRHLNGQAGRNTHRPAAALLVHGMDIPLERDDFYINAASRAERMLDGTGVPLIWERTNARKLGMNWEDSYGLQLFSSFLVFQGCYSWAIKASGEPYDELVLPWGSTPLTDQLCATEAMQLVLDGCAFDRTEKVRWLSENTEILDDLRVCWAGENLDRNCGVCEKCVRTMLNFWAVGREVPAAFPTELTPKLVRSIRPRNETQLRELKTVMHHAALAYPRGDPILRALGFVIRRAQFAEAKRSLTNRVRSFLGRE
ncbi:hypothetical protein dsat_1292 [Alkalidesulfovibrio alkalitolerans DSM 16529]|uniref:Uncharacterized protein n=1 Tax=Alkalidesulfovibrio alkalitolerans DSM 16529 TaxID=1121439 RepID=S7T230_9BACT|nr:hypothetical protein [Alkalidesulfovibrio alkalitolerans]EPR30570.1 hypothetical protein dsat_1292 [Alkalidesulfovibrio alkalitolerans DSM 16529]